MGVDPHAERGRTWPRNGNRIDAPADSTMEKRIAAAWLLTCVEYGIDPDNPPPMRKDVVRVGRLQEK